jgi:hypothetical protein
MVLKKTSPDDLKIATGAGTVALVGVASAINPALGIAVGMAAALFGPAIERRQDRAGQLIQFVNDNISEFSDIILEDDVFQDGFVFLIEKHIRERNDDKRTILQQILLGYCKAPDLLDFPLEEMTDLVSRIRMSDVAVFRSALESELTLMDGRNPSFMVRQDPNSVSRLIYFGLLHEDREKNGPSIREHDDKNLLYVWVTPTGRAFAEYLGVPRPMRREKSNIILPEFNKNSY